MRASNWSGLLFNQEMPLLPHVLIHKKSETSSVRPRMNTLAGAVGTRAAETVAAVDHASKAGSTGPVRLDLSREEHFSSFPEPFHDVFKTDPFGS